MKRIIFSLLTFTSLVGFAQRPTATPEQLEAFFTTTTYVIKRDDLMNEYNSYMEQAFKTAWKSTEFEFITYTEFQEKQKDPNASFVLLTETSFLNDKVVTGYNFISVVLGGDYENINKMPEICSFPLISSDTEDEEIMATLPAIMTFITQHIVTMKSNPKLLKDKKYKFYTKQKKAIVSKNMYLVKENQTETLQKENAIQSLYKGKFTFVSYDDIATAIAEQNNTVVFHIRVAANKATVGARCYTIVMGVDGTLYYYNYHTITNEKTTNGITAKQWKAFNKFVK